MKRAVLLSVVAVLLLAACSGGQVRRNDDDAQQGYISGSGTVTLVPEKKREPAPEFSGELLDGGEFDLADERGNVVVLNIWGSWCPPCRDEAPGLQAVYEDVKDDGVKFVGVNIRDTKTGARNYEDEFGITYPSVFDPKTESLTTFRDSLPPNAVPSTLIVDCAGRIAVRVLGAISEGSLREMVGDVAECVA